MTDSDTATCYTVSINLETESPIPRWAQICTVFGEQQLAEVVRLLIAKQPQPYQSVLVTRQAVDAPAAPE